MRRAAFTEGGDTFDQVFAADQRSESGREAAPWQRDLFTRR
jgi:hypothetical protein